MKKGDIFRWSYKDTKGKDYTMLYWCCSRIAVFDGKRLIDTYWTSSSENKKWDEVKAKEELNLEFLANESDLIKKDDAKLYFDEKDVVDLTHPNSYGKNIFIRKGAKPSKERMLEIAYRMLSDAEYKERRARRDMENLRELIEKIKSSDDVYMPYPSGLDVGYY